MMVEYRNNHMNDLQKNDMYAFSGVVQRNSILSSNKMGRGGVKLKVKNKIVKLKISRLQRKLKKASMCYSFSKRKLYKIKVVVVEFEADCLAGGSRSMGGMCSVGVFVRDPSPYLRKFRRKPQKTPNG